MNPDPELGAFFDRLVERVAQRILELQHEQPARESEDRSPWMAVDAAAAYLDWPKQRLYKLSAAGAIPHYKHDGRLLFHRQELDHWLRDFAQPVKPLAWPQEQSYS